MRGRSVCAYLHGIVLYHVYMMHECDVLHDNVPARDRVARRDVLYMEITPAKWMGIVGGIVAAVVRSRDKRQTGLVECVLCDT